jgi:hypothetical protein
MFRSAWSAEDQQAVERIAEKIKVNLGAEDIAGSEATFASIEAAASKIGKAVTRHVIEDLAIKQAQLVGKSHPCPTCEKLCPVELRDRELATGEGPVDLSEAVCHCSVCRRDFFPSTGSIETPPTRL